MEEPTAGIYFADKRLEGLMEECRDVKLMTSNEPDLNLPNIQSVLRHLYLDGLSLSKTGRVTGCGTVITVTTASHDPSSILRHG